MSEQAPNYASPLYPPRCSNCRARWNETENGCENRHCTMSYKYQGKRPSPTKTCAACHWFVAGVAGNGRCHRYPPAALPSLTTWAYPLVSADDFCGEFLELAQRDA